MIKAARIPIRRPFALPSFSWLAQPRKPADPASEADRAVSDRRRESVAAARRDTAHARLYRAGYRDFL